MNLYDYSNLTAPRVSLQRQLFHPEQRTKVIGHTGFDTEREEVVAAFPRHPDEHYYQKYGGYALSEQVLEEVAARNTHTVLIVERTEDGTVWEFDTATFSSGAAVVYSREENTTIEGDDAIEAAEREDGFSDVQRVAPCAEARTRWAVSEVTIE
jgi:hypothetical protein